MPDALVLKPAPGGGSGFQLWRHHSLLPPPCSLKYNNIGSAAQRAIDQALEFNRLMATLAGTHTLLVTLGGDEFPVQWPPNPATAELLAMARDQYPAALGPTEGPWRLQDPRNDERAAVSVRAADLVTAMQAGTWALDTPLLIVFGDGDGDDDGDGDKTAGAAVHAGGGQRANDEIPAVRDSFRGRCVPPCRNSPPFQGGSAANTYERQRRQHYTFSHPIHAPRQTEFRKYV